MRATALQNSMAFNRRRLLRAGMTATKSLFWLGLMTLIGLVVGVMVVIMPPLAWIAVVALSIGMLLWVMPDLNLVPEDVMRRLFFFAVAVQFAVPLYYAFAVPGLPWISIRRLTWFPMISVAALTLASSHLSRHRIAEIVGETKLISIPAIGFLVSIFLSVLTSKAWTDSLRDASDAFLYWYMAFFGCLLCIRNEKDVRIVLKIICFLALLAGFAGITEYVLQRHFIAQFWPEAMIERLFADNPYLFDNIVRNVIRNGQFRANYIYNVSLSYGEFLAVCAPICLYFSLRSRSWWEFALGCLGTLACVLGIFASGSRGAYFGASVAMPLVVSLWIIRYMKENPSSLVGMIATATLVSFVSGFATLAIFWARLRVLFTGGYEGAGSTDTRFAQWELAKPWIISNPITGHGAGLGGGLVGFYNPGSPIPSLDSYIISLLVEVGIPGFLFFFLMIGFSAILLLRVYILDSEEASSSAGAIACALVSFGLYRIALSQRENHVLLFLLVGMGMVVVFASARRSLRPAVHSPRSAVDASYRAMSTA